MIYFSSKVFLLIALLCSLCSIARAGADDAWHAHYLANSGVMVASGATKVLFDPFFRNDYERYQLVPAAMEAAIFAGEAPWDGIDAIFISHHHSDHFDPALLLDYLRRWPGVQLYAPQQAAAAVLAEDADMAAAVASRINGLALANDGPAVAIEAGEILVEAVRIPHAGWPEHNAEVENVVFRVSLDAAATVIHLGDAANGRDLYAAHEDFWEARPTDLALAPVWLLLNDKGRYVLSEYVDAEHEIGMHLFKTIPQDPAQRPALFDGVDIFTRPGETREFD